jgi:hypothetical protein
MSDAQSGENRARLKIFLLCLVSALGNVLSGVTASALHAPLYLDTLFNCAVTFAAGFVPGLLTGALLFPLFSGWTRICLMRVPPAAFWPTNFFVICVISEIVLVWLFRSRLTANAPALDDSGEKPFARSFAGAVSPLMALIALDCVVVSVTGGLVDYTVYTLFAAPSVKNPENIFKLGLLRGSLPFLFSAILSRIPINIVDRFIVIFGGYGVSLLYRRFLGFDKTRG